MVDPSKFTKALLDELWNHWEERAKLKQPILRFIQARPDDMGIQAALANVADRPKKRKPYVELSDSEEEDVPVIAGKGRAFVNHDKTMSSMIA